jgi:hypothetical protein
MGGTTLIPHNVVGEQILGLPAIRGRARKCCSMPHLGYAA